MTKEKSLQRRFQDSDVMLFFKFYDPAKEKIHYMGHMYVAITSKVSSMVPELGRRANLPPNTQVIKKGHLQMSEYGPCSTIDS